MADTTAGAAPRGALHVFMLFAILALAFALRYWGAFFDLPYILHPDEPFNVSVVQGMYERGSLNPHFFHYPSVFYYVNLLAAEIWFGARAVLTGVPWDPQAPVILALGTTKVADVDGVVLFRCVTLLVGTLSVWMCYLIGSKAYDRRVGLLAALLLAISPVAVVDSRNLTPDSYLLPTVLLAILASLSLSRSGTWRAYLVAGAAVGLAAATKYTGAVVASAVIAAHFAYVGTSVRNWQRLLAAGAISAVAFLACTPYVLLDYAEFSRAGLHMQFDHYSGGHAGMDGASTLFYLRALWTLTGVAALAAVAYLWRALRERRGADLVLAGFAIPYLIFICLFNVRNDRTLQPAIPCVLLFAAAFFTQARTWLAQRTQISPGLRQLLLGALALALVLAPLRLTVLETLRATTPDSRSTARAWIEQNVPAGAAVAVENYAPFVEPTRYNVVRLERAIDHEADWYLAQKVDYVVMSQGMFGRYFDQAQTYPAEVGAYFRLMRAFTQIKRFDTGNFIVYVYRTSTPP